MHPAAADHRRDDVDRLELVGRARERIAGEHDEVGEITREEFAAASLVAREPRGIDARREKRLLDREALLGVPCGTVVGRSPDPCTDTGEGVELLDRRVRAVRNERARLP